MRAQSLIGEYFVDCEAGRSEREVPDGGRVPVAQTASTIPPDLVNTVQRRPYKERFRLILSELGTGLAGRPEDLNEVIRRAHPSLRELSETIAILRGQNTIIRDFIRDADRVSVAVDPVRESVAKWAREAEDVTRVQASRSERAGPLLQPAAAVPGRAEADDGGAGAHRGRPDPDPAQAARGGARADRLPARRRAVRARVAQLDRRPRRARPSPVARPSASPPRRSASCAGSPRSPRGWPSRCASSSRRIDDRKRSTDNEPLARVTAPPAPDKTAYKAGQGFTGMEALLNYVYYQTLGVNAFDEFGHLLRITAFTGGPCSPYSTQPTEAVRKQCASHLGPTSRA